MAAPAATLTTREAEGELRRLNGRSRMPIPNAMLKSLPPVYVFSLWHESFRVPLGLFGTFVIPACEEGEEYAGPVNMAGREAIPGVIPQEYDLGDGAGTMGVFFEEGRKVARALVGMDGVEAGLSAWTTNKEHFGVFIAAGPIPTGAEIAAARLKLEATMQLYLRRGDTLARQNKFAEIGAPERYAANYLRQRRDWSRLPEQNAECPSCMEPMNPRARFCTVCKSTIDPETREILQGPEGARGPAGRADGEQRSLIGGGPAAPVGESDKNGAARKR